MTRGRKRRGDIAANMGTGRVYVVVVAAFFVETWWSTFACGRAYAYFSNLWGMPEVSLRGCVIMAQVKRESAGHRGECLPKFPRILRQVQRDPNLERGKYVALPVQL